MNTKPIVPREQALRDIDDAIDHYLTEAGERVALGFIDALEQACRSIGRHPSASSPRYAHELALPGLRSHLLKRYPYIVFYVELADRIDVWRILHARRDIPASLQGSESN